MRQPDEMPMDPDVLAELEVIDLTLAGEPVDPEYAELAELALMLQMERQPPREEYARRLDARASVRFRPRPVSGSDDAAEIPPSTKVERLRRWFSGPAPRVAVAGLMAAAIATVVIVNTHSGGATNSAAEQSAAGAQASANVSSASTTSSSSTAGASASSTTSSSTLGSASHQTGKTMPPLHGSKSVNSGSGSSGAAANKAINKGLPGEPYGPLSGATSSSVTVPSPSAPGRKIVQSAQITLTAANDRIDAVSQEVFNVVAQEHGIVKSSHVSSVAGKRGGSASFTLSVPSGNLETTLQDLSTLRYAHVVSRTNSTQDVTKTYRNERHQLQDAQALRTSLLKQLAAAVTQTEIDSLNAQIHDAEARITQIQNALNALQHRVSFSSLSVQLYSGNPPPIVAPKHGSGGFTLSSATHDAGRVLVVAAGVMLIAAAALVPVGLLALLIYWIVDRLRRHSREEALDQA